MDNDDQWRFQAPCGRSRGGAKYSGASGSPIYVQNQRPDREKNVTEAYSIQSYRLTFNNNFTSVPLKRNSLLLIINMHKNAYSI